MAPANQAQFDAETLPGVLPATPEACNILLHAGRCGPVGSVVYGDGHRSFILFGATNVVGEDSHSYGAITCLVVSYGLTCLVPGQLLLFPQPLSDLQSGWYTEQLCQLRHDRVYLTPGVDRPAITELPFVYMASAAARRQLRVA